MHTDPTNAARVRPEQTDAKTLTRSQNEYESITFEQCCEQVPNEAAVEAELEELKKIVEVKTDNPDIYPAIYPDKYKKKYDEIYAKRDWASSYPFHKDNVINFINFAKQSGGFSIC